MILSPEQRALLRRLLADELRAACRTTTTEPAALGRALDANRLAVTASIPDADSLTDDPQGLGHDPVEDAPVGE